VHCQSRRRRVVRQDHGSIFERLSKGLHAHFDDVSKEVLPQRWIDLIRYLDEKERIERKVARAERERRKQSSNGRR
jgi:hypothetical protein